MIPTLSFGEGVWLQGMFDCGYWLDERRDNPQSIQLQTATIAYANGYATGIQSDVWQKPTKISPSQLNYLVDQKCRDDPTLLIWQALDIILLERVKGGK